MAFINLRAVSASGIILCSMEQSTEIVHAFASTTGEIMTDTIPLIVYFIGIFFVVMFLSLLYKGLVKPIKKIFYK